MHLNEFNFIYERLNTPADVEAMSQKMGYPREMLYNILGHKVTRDVTRRFYVVKRDEGKLLSHWIHGETLLQIARSIKFSPVLTARFILMKKGFSKHQLREAINEPEKIRDPRLRKEMAEVVKDDFVYAPWATKIQNTNGRDSEDAIAAWLDSKKIDYTTEKQRRGTAVKTPDFLFEKAIDVNGHMSVWIESKSSFGDEKELRRDYKKQLSQYVKLFGPGTVCYWWGFIDDLKIDEKVQLLDRTSFGVKA
jgi:hypothetical protein